MDFYVFFMVSLTPEKEDKNTFETRKKKRLVQVERKYEIILTTGKLNKVNSLNERNCIHFTLVLSGKYF